MKTLAICILFLIFGGISFSQTNNFAPIGAKWYYDDYSNNCPTFPNCGYILIESIKDTVVLGKTCRVLYESYYTPYNDIEDTSYVIYENLGIVYLFNGGQFHKLYDFNAEEGDTIKVFEDAFFGYYSFTDYEFTDFAYVIEAIEVVSIDGQELICQTAKSTDSELGWGFGQFKIYEKIGSVGLFLGNPNITPLEFGSFLRCYEDDELSYHDESYLNNCDFITSVYITLPVCFDIYPNPTTEFLHFANHSFLEGNIVIYDLFGSIVYSSSITPNSTISIDLPNYSSFFIGVVNLLNSESYSFNILKL